MRTVAERISDYLLTSNVQLGASYAVSQQSGARVRDAHLSIAELIGAARPDEIVMGPSTTALMYTLAAALAKEIGAGDEFVVTDTDHEANIGPWLKLAEQKGAVVKTWRLSAQKRLSWSLPTYAPTTPRTKLVCFTHASNILGTINPVAEITRFVHERGAQGLLLMRWRWRRTARSRRQAGMSISTSSASTRSTARTMPCSTANTNTCWPCPA